MKNIKKYFTGIPLMAYIVCLIVVQSGVIYAQSGNAKSLDVGNKWIYFVRSLFGNHYETNEVIGDTIINDNKYAVILVDSVSHKYQRADSVRIFEFNPVDSAETVVADFSLEIGDSLNSTVLTSKDSVYILGRTLTEICLAFDFPGLYFYDECYTELIGITYGYYGGVAINNKEISLKAALINGKVYGDTTLVSVKESQKTLPVNYKLFQNYPNPFNPSTMIRYSISEYSNVSLKIYNSLGQEVATLVDGEKQPGKYGVKFDASKYNLTSGIYFYRFKIDKATITKKAVFIK